MDVNSSDPSTTTLSTNNTIIISSAPPIPLPLINSNLNYSSTVLQQINTLEALCSIYFYYQTIVAIIGVPIVILSFYLIIAQTPKHFHFVKHLLIHTLVANTIIAYSLAIVRPLRMPNSFGGFASGFSPSDQYGFLICNFFSASAAVINGILSVLSFKCCTEQLKVSNY